MKYNSEANKSKILKSSNNYDDILISQKPISKVLNVSRRGNPYSQFIDMIHLYNILERMMYLIIIVFLIIPTFQTIINLYVHFKLIKNITVQFIISMTYLSCKVAKFRQKIPQRVQQSENLFFLYTIMLFDIDYVYLLTKYPEYTQEIIYERSNYLIESNIFISYTQYMSYLISLGQKNYLLCDFYILLFAFTYAFSLSLLRYKDYYPKQEGQSLFEYLCKKQFALANLHIMSFMAVLIAFILLSLQSFQIILGYIVFYSSAYLLYYFCFSVRQMFIFAPIDIKLHASNIAHSKVLEIGLIPFYKRHQFWILQKTTIIVLYIYRIIKFLYFKQHYITFYYCFINCIIITISIISLVFLYSYYIQQKRFLFGKNRQFLEIFSAKELEDLMIKDLGDKKQFAKVKFVHFFNQRDQQPKISLIICCLFHNFANAQIIFKGQLYNRIYIKQKISKNKVINIQDLHQLQYINHTQQIVNGIQEVKIQSSSEKQNQKIFHQLLKIGCSFSITLKSNNSSDIQYLTYNKYVATLQKIKHQIIAFQNHLSFYIVNNPHQVLYDLYD
ncbi:hypothetical protein ABPG72_007819 [Tetrahymena utriculariae]